jgi:hypothetical protein
MATYTKYRQFVKDLIDGVHDFHDHTFRVSLHNTAPAVTDSVFGDLTEISAGSGYSAGGTVTDISTSVSTGVAKATAPDVVFTASGGSIGPFRYVNLYNDTPSSPLNPLVCFFDYGGAVTLADTETFTVDFDGSNGLFDLQ